MPRSHQELISPCETLAPGRLKPKKRPLAKGNPVERRLERLREFWNRVSSGMPLIALAQLDPLRVGLNRLSALAAAAFGVPGFFSSRMPPAVFALDGTPEALSVYETSPLRKTLDVFKQDAVQHEARSGAREHAPSFRPAHAKASARALRGLSDGVQVFDLSR